MLYCTGRHKIFTLHPVSHGKYAPVASHVEPLHFFEIEGARADPAKHRDLVSTLVDPAVALETARQAERGGSGRVPGNELRFRLGRKAVEIGLALGRHQLD